MDKFVLYIKRKGETQLQEYFIKQTNGELHISRWGPVEEDRPFDMDSIDFSSDFGRVILPDGKTLSGLVNGDLIEVEEEGQEPYYAVYQGQFRYSETQQSLNSSGH